MTKNSASLKKMPIFSFLSRYIESWTPSTDSIWPMLTYGILQICLNDLLLVWSGVSLALDKSNATFNSYDSCDRMATSVLPLIV